MTTKKSQEDLKHQNGTLASQITKIDAALDQALCNSNAQIFEAISGL